MRSAACRLGATLLSPNAWLIPLHVVTVRLSRVFDVARDPISRTESTLFSFETSDGLRCLSMRLPGRPRLAVGDTVTAVLLQPGNWQTLLGLRNHNTGEVNVRGGLGLTVVLRSAVVTGLTLAWWGGAASGASRMLATAALGFCALLMGALARQQWLAWRARRLLEQS